MTSRTLNLYLSPARAEALDYIAKQLGISRLKAANLILDMTLGQNRQYVGAIRQALYKSLDEARELSSKHD